MRYLNELKKLNLPLGEYSIVGSGPIIIRLNEKIENNDIDLILSKKLWDKLIKEGKGKLVGSELRLTKHINAYSYWYNAPKSTEFLIKTSEIIGGFPYVKLRYALNYKLKFRRKKDFIHLVFLIKNYLGKLFHLKLN